jgi:LacI family transcriptional regulator
VAATMRDVAQQAGVSIKTVSRVVNDQGEISEATRERVLAVIQKLGYRPSKVARALVTQKTHTIGLVLGDVTYNPFFPEVARGVLDAAQAQGYNVFLCNVEENQDHELEILHSLADHAVDGIIIYPTHYSQENLKTFANSYRPLISINKCIEHPGVATIFLQTRKGAKLAVDYLAKKGYSKIGMIANASPLNVVQRVCGFKEGMAANGLTVVDEWIIQAANPTYEAGYAAMQIMLDQHPEVEAIFAYNDLLAMGAIQACREAGCRVPADWAIVGFDDIEWAAKTTPPLTTIRVDKYKLGQLATQRLFEMFDDHNETPPPIYLDVELVVRESA